MPDLRLVTNISQAYWCDVTGDGLASFEPAQVSLHDSPSPTPVAWFDKLFDGGILVPEESGRSLTMLFTGPPGSGKSTLAIELCHRSNMREAGTSEAGTPVSSLYISLESEAKRLIANAKSLGYKNFDKNAVVFGEEEPAGKVLAIWGRERMDAHLRQSKVTPRETSLSEDSASLFLEALLKFPIVETKKIVEKAIANTQKPILIDTKGATKTLADSRADIIVIDSLNVIGADERPDFFEKFLREIPISPKLVIFVLDSVPRGEPHPHWEFVCDNVVRTGYQSPHNYYTRSIEIVKARYQSHVWGRHQLKIYPRPTIPPENINGKINQDRTEQMLRSHPFRTEGGVFIFPSLHYYLSLYKRRGAAERIEQHEGPLLDDVDPGCPGLEQIVRFPRGRCTAFVGARGGHKSHLGYVHLLSRVPHDEAALVISLREDEQRSYSTMQGILNSRPERIKIRDLRARNQLEVVYYHPGYITPEEFFHRMFISVQRLKRRGRPLTVMFNSLDQLGAKFPLCAREEGFVAGVIEALTGEHATSIFIAVDEPGQPPEQYGLLAMADLILSFYPYEFTREDYLRHVRAGTDGKNPASVLGRVSAKDARKIRHEEIVLQVVRYAGGLRAGARGILELVEAKKTGRHKKSIHKEPGLHFSPLDERAEPGTRLYERRFR